MLAKLDVLLVELHQAHLFICIAKMVILCYNMVICPSYHIIKQNLPYSNMFNSMISIGQRPQKSFEKNSNLYGLTSMGRGMFIVALK
jgi:hypothetical protein